MPSGVPSSVVPSIANSPQGIQEVPVGQQFELHGGDVLCKVEKVTYRPPRRNGEQYVRVKIWSKNVSSSEAEEGCLIEETYDVEGGTWGQCDDYPKGYPVSKRGLATTHTITCSVAAGTQLARLKFRVWYDTVGEKAIVTL